jgi:hypothetical protein
MLSGLGCSPQGDHRHSTKGWYDSDDMICRYHMIGRDHMIYRDQMIGRDQVIYRVNLQLSHWVVSGLAAEPPTICPGHPGATRSGPAEPTAG